MRLDLPCAVGCAAICALYAWQSNRLASECTTAPPQKVSQALPGGGSFTATAVGHEYREDDLPAIAAAPNGAVWVAFLSFNGTRDDVALRSWNGEQWSNLACVISRYARPRPPQRELHDTP